MSYKKAPKNPNLKIDWKIVDAWLMQGCTGLEIAEHIGVDADTLYERCTVETGSGFSGYAQRKKAKGDALLRSKQYQKAMAGSEKMLIHLGKHRLGQWDKKDDMDANGIANLAELKKSFEAGEICQQQ